MSCPIFQYTEETGNEKEGKGKKGDKEIRGLYLSAAISVQTSFQPLDSWTQVYGLQSPERSGTSQKLLYSLVHPSDLYKDVMLDENLIFLATIFTNKKRKKLNVQGVKYFYR